MLSSAFAAVSVTLSGHSGARSVWQTYQPWPRFRGPRVQSAAVVDIFAAASEQVPTASWVDFADAVLSRGVARARRQAPHAAEGAAAGIHLAAPVALSIAELDLLVSTTRARFRASLDDDNPFAAVAANAELTADEAELLAVLVACEGSLHRQRMVAFLQDDALRTQVMLQTVAVLFDGGHAGVLALGANSGLRTAALVDVDGAGPWGQHIVSVAAGVMWAIAGETAPDPALPWKARMINGEGMTEHSFVIVTGRDRLRRQQAAVGVANGERFLVCSAPDSVEGWSAVVREATLAGTGVIIETEEPLPVLGRRWIERAKHLTWVLSSRASPDLHDLPLRPRVEIEAAEDETTDDEWQRTFGAHERTHPIAPEQLESIGLTFEATGGNLDAAVRRLVGGRLEKLARRIRPRLSWDDLVLSPERTEQLHEITINFRSHARVYGEWGFDPGSTHGLVLLFSGPSGAGKTLSAEVIANELGMEIFKLETSAVVSKYIGETEKNLEEVFDAASAGNLVLFFDEADALFGKRSEVKDARDRYANLEVSYLLQRLERYAGIVILATNFEKNLDEAFLRRIDCRVDFALPTEPERLAIWQLNLPATAPVGDVDLASLARRFSLSGASIKNAAVHAAFLAAADGSEITTALLVSGIAHDYRKFGKLVKADEFGELF